MRDALETLAAEFAFQTSGRFDLLASEHVPYSAMGASDVDDALRRSIERGEGITTVVGRMGSGKSSLIAAVANSLDEGFLPLRVSVIGIEAGDPAAFARHAITEIRDVPEAQLARHEERALDRASAERRTQTTTRELRAGFEIAAGPVLTPKVIGDIKTAAKEELSRATDPSHALRGIQRLLDVFWGMKDSPFGAYCADSDKRPRTRGSCQDAACTSERTRLSRPPLAGSRRPPPRSTATARSCGRRAHG